LNFGKGPGCEKSSPQEGYRACRPGGGQRGADREAESERLGGPLYLAPGATRGEDNGWPWFTGLYTDYVSFKLNWEKYYGEKPQPISQAELVRQFREDCMSEKTAKRLKGASSMTEAWAMMDEFYYVTKGLMWGFQGLAAIKKRHFERKHDHYFLIQYSISAADEARQGHLLLVFEITLWWEAWGHMGSKDLGSTFSAFVEEWLDWSLAQMTGTGADCARPTHMLAKNHKQDTANASREETVAKWVSGTPERLEPWPEGTQRRQEDTWEGGMSPPLLTSETGSQGACQ
jgi:hypothetical protein